MSRPWDNQPSGVMKALVLTSPGEEPPSACFTYTESYPKPTLPGPGWVLVRIRGTGINRAELRGRANQPAFPGEFNLWQKYYHPDPPKILGEELVGEIVEAADDTPFKPGEKVISTHAGGGKAFDGSYAEYAICHSRRVYHLPQETTVSWDQLGALGMSYLTAYGMVMMSGRLGDKPQGSSVIVHGATSSVGIFALLIAKDHGATVIATTRQSKKFDKLKNCGADYTLLESDLDVKIPQILPDGADLVVELVGADQAVRALGWTALFGSVVVSGVLNSSAVIEAFSPFLIPTTRNLTFYSVANDGAGDHDAGARHSDLEPVFAYAVKNIENGKWEKEQFIDSVYHLPDIGIAHERAEKNEATGKLVVLVP
ncbi:Alcohol dehydrogenase GroES-like domain-containing protein [Cladophialophora immunda]|nr:Alcohol dehydrogenase GroES-like domain-containing protein [Cladophialophora immunda]